MNVNTFLDCYPGWVVGWSKIDNKAILSSAELCCCWGWAELGKINCNKAGLQIIILSYSWTDLIEFKPIIRL